MELRNRVFIWKNNVAWKSFLLLNLFKATRLFLLVTKNIHQDSSTSNNQAWLGSGVESSGTEELAAALPASAESQICNLLLLENLKGRIDFPSVSEREVFWENFHIKMTRKIEALKSFISCLSLLLSFQDFRFWEIWSGTWPPWWKCLMLCDSDFQMKKNSQGHLLMGLQCFVRWGFLQDFSPIDAAAAAVDRSPVAVKTWRPCLGTCGTWPWICKWPWFQAQQKTQQKLCRMMDG